jgi:hypothetical protein
VTLAGVFNIVIVSLAAVFFTPSHDGTAADEQQPDFVAVVRGATEQFLDVHRAHDAHYEPFLGCVSGPQEGAMGVHFVNGALVGDGELDVNHPEALIYEPTDGGARLVGVEYIVLVEDWHKHHRDLVGAPVLNGQVFHFNDSPNRFGLPPFYELHVWAWQDNPRGTFVDWNTLVSCDGAR